jgi:acyl transferase domain-containing protein
LPSPYAFHSSLLADLIGPLTERIRHLQARPLTTPVFSSTLGRFYRPDDQVPEQIARALVAPARFARSVAQLADAGASTFVECGGGAALTGLVRKVLPSVTATAGTEWLARLQTEPTKPTIRAASISTIPTAIPTPAHVISTARPAPLPPAVAQSAADPATREALFAELVAMYAEALEYPTEVFTESVSLEADLGIDSVKQTELLARAADRYGLPEAQPEGFRLSDLDTMGKVVNYLWSVHNGLAASTPDVSTPFVRSASSAGPATAQHPLTPVVAAPVLTAVAQSAADPATREALFAELVAMYAEALEYPTEVFTESVSLEADLGIDSVKQTELLARAADRYGLPEAQPEGFRLSDLDTMGKVVNYLWSMSTAVGSPVVTDVRAVAA